MIKVIKLEWLGRIIIPCSTSEMHLGTSMNGPENRILVTWLVDSLKNVKNFFKVHLNWFFGGPSQMYRRASETNLG